MRRLLPLLAIALVGIVGYMLFFNESNSPEPLTADNDSEVVTETPEEAGAGDSTQRRSTEAVVADVPFTNRPLKKGIGRHQLGGLVVDEAGQPVANAWVGAYSSPFAIADFEMDPEEILEKPLELALDPLASTRTDKDGRFMLDGVPGRALYVTARAPMRLSNGRMRINPEQLGQVDGVTIKTYAAAALEGVVRDSSGAAVVNAEVLVYPGIKYLLSALRKRDVFVERAYTDGAGKFQIEAVPAGMVLNASAFNGPTHPGTSEFGPSGKNTIQRTTVELLDLGTLEGNILNTDDEPVGYARVAAIPLDLRMVIPVLRNVPGWMTTSNGAGKYSFEGLPFGQYLLVAQGEEGRSAPQSARILGPRDNVQDLLIDMRNEVNGRVINSDGEPVRNATIALMSEPEPPDSGGGRRNQMNFLLEMAREALPEILPAETESKSDGQGKFRISAWRQARVRVTAPGYVTSDFRFRSLGDDKNPVLVMQRPGGLTGQVVTADDETPIQFFVLQSDLRQNALGNSRSSMSSSQAVSELVVAEPEKEDDQGQSVATSPAPAPIEDPRAILEASLADDEQLLIAQAPSLDEIKRTRYIDDPDGRFEVTDMAPGRWNIRVRAEGYETERKSIYIKEGEITEDEVFTLGQGAILSGTIVAKDTGNPVDAALITANGDQEGGFSLLAQGFVDGSAVTTSKPEGSFELRGVEKNADYVHVMADGFASESIKIEKVQDGERRDGIEIQLSVGGSITGTVTDRNQIPLPRRMVVAFSPGSRDFQQGATDEGGVYRIDNMRPGNYMLVSVALDDESLFTGDFMSILSGGRFVSAVVEENKTTTVDIVDSSAGGCRLTGRLTKAGVPVAGAMMNSIGMGGSGMLDFRMATARTDENGNFTFKSLAPGEYSLNVDSEDWSGQLDLYVDDLPEDFVELRVPETVVEGRILSSLSSQPLEGIRVRMIREDAPGGMASMFGGGGGWRLRATTDANGMYRIEGAPIGDYHLTIEPDNFNFNDDELQMTDEIASFRRMDSDSFFLDFDERRSMPDIQLEAAGGIRALVKTDDGKDFERGFEIRAVPIAGAQGEDDEFQTWGWNGKGTLAGLPAGSYLVTISARGYANSTQQASVVAGQVREIEFQLGAGVELSARVLDSNGRPNDSAAITVYNSAGEIVHQERGGENSALRNFFSGGGDGTRGLGSFAPGSYRIVAIDGNKQGESSVSLDVATGARVVEVRL